MKKLISIVLMLVLIFALAVPSFAATDITNWPTYFTGQYDSQIYGTLTQILDELDEGLKSIDYTTYDIFEILSDNVEISQERWNYFEEIVMPYISGLYSNTGSIFSIIQELHFEEMDYYKEEMVPSITSAIGGVTSAVNRNTDWVQYDYYALVDFYDRFDAEFNKDTGEGSAGYALYMLQQVLADEDDLALKESQKDNQESAFDNFFNGGNSFEYNTSLNFDSFKRLSEGITSFGNFFSNVGEGSLSPTLSLYGGFQSVFAILNNEDVGGDGFLPFGWFSQATADNISSVPSTFSRDPSIRIVTNYYGEQMERFENFFRGD